MEGAAAAVAGSELWEGHFEGDLWEFERTGWFWCWFFGGLFGGTGGAVLEVDALLMLLAPEAPESSLARLGYEAIC